MKRQRTAHSLSIHCGLGLLLLTMAVGCGGGATGPELFPVEGTVTMDGQPLANAWVVFYPESKDRPSKGTTDANGHYTLQWASSGAGAVAGKHKVFIGTKQDVDAEGNEVPDAKETVPAKYNDETELSAQVDGSESTFNFDLTSS